PLGKMTITKLLVSLFTEGFLILSTLLMSIPEGFKWSKGNVVVRLRSEEAHVAHSASQQMFCLVALDLSIGDFRKISHAVVLIHSAIAISGKIERIPDPVY